MVGAGAAAAAGTGAPSPLTSASVQFLEMWPVYVSKRALIGYKRLTSLAAAVADLARRVEAIGTSRSSGAVTADVA